MIFLSRRTDYAIENLYLFVFNKPVYDKYIFLLVEYFVIVSSLMTCDFSSYNILIEKHRSYNRVFIHFHRRYERTVDGEQYRKIWILPDSDVHISQYTVNAIGRIYAFLRIYCGRG